MILVGYTLWPLLDLAVVCQIVPCLPSRLVQESPSRVIRFLWLDNLAILFSSRAIGDRDVLRSLPCLPHRRRGGLMCGRACLEATAVQAIITMVNLLILPLILDIKFCQFGETSALGGGKDA